MPEIRRGKREGLSGSRLMLVHAGAQDGFTQPARTDVNEHQDGPFPNPRRLNSLATKISSTACNSEKWSARQDLHLRSLGPRPSMLLLHHALFAPADLGGRRGLGSVGTETSFPGTGLR